MDDEQTQKKEKSFFSMPDITDPNLIPVGDITEVKPSPEPEPIEPISPDFSDLTFGPSYIHLTAVLAFGALFSLIFMPSGDTGTGFSIWMFFLLFAFIAVASLLAIIAERPRITLTKQGISLQQVFKTKRYKWSEVGKFRVYSHVHDFHTTRYLSAAFANKYESAMLHNSDLADHLDFHDIGFEITYMVMGRTDRKAEVLAHEINRWRQEFYVADENAVYLTRDEIKAIETKFEEKKEKSLHFLIAVLLLGPFLMMFYIYWQTHS